MAARRRGDAVRELAGILSDEAGVPVAAEWRTGGPGRWVLSWTDGPTRDAIRSRAGELVAGLGGLLAPLRGVELGFARSYSGRAVACLLLDLARERKLPADPDARRTAATTLEYDLDTTGYPTARDAATLRAADALAEAGRHQPGAMADILAERGRRGLGLSRWPKPAQVSDARPLRGAWVWRLERYRGIVEVTRHPVTVETQPRNDTGCGACGGPVQRHGTGRPARFCSSACRLRAYRAAHRTADATKPGNETGCAQCGAPVRQPVTGRPARFCSPACRLRSYRATHAA